MSFDLRFVADHRDLVRAEVRKAASRAFQEAGEFLLEEANRTVPIEEGTLGRSGTVTTSRAGSNGADVVVTTVVAYDTPYAARQHEELGYQHDQGRRAKWAEQTFKEQRDAVGDFIADRIRKAVG